MDEQQNTKEKKNIWHTTFAVFFVVPALLFWFVFIIVLLGLFDVLTNDEGCNVARIPLQGVLMTTENGLGNILDFGPVTSADSIVESIEKASEDETIEAIMIDVDSPGGTPVAGDEIMTALMEATKPTVAVVRDRGASAAYWAIAGADYIVASPVSDVGSIGVTMSYLELASSTENEGSRWVDISSGKFKDAGNPDRVLREEEQTYFKSQVDGVFEYMVERIAEGRKNLQKEEIEHIADGRAFLGSEAFSLGLIDEVGGFEVARKYLSGVLQIELDEVKVCTPERSGLGDLLY